VERVTLNVELKNGTGKSITRKLRAKGLVPGIVYGKNELPVQVTADSRELVKLLHQQGENIIIDLNFKGAAAGTKTVIVKEIQYDTIKNTIVHIDFQQIKLTEKIRVHVPLTTKGGADAPGVKEGGVLEHILRDVEIECLPANLPREILVDVSGLKISEPVFVKDLIAPEGVTLLNDPEQIAVLIKYAAEEKPAEEKVEPEAVEPELVKKKKPEEETTEEK
jgi:large subunit ribosomal protein L25